MHATTPILRKQSDPRPLNPRPISPDDLILPMQD